MKQAWFLLAALAVVIPASATDMYSWTDAQGVKHFSDSPPPANVTKAQKLKVKGGVTRNADDPVDDQASDSDGPALAAAAGYSPEEIERNCGIARRNLEGLEAEQPALDEDGNPADAEAAATRQSQVDKANQQIKLFCSK